MAEEAKAIMNCELITLFCGRHQSNPLGTADGGTAVKVTAMIREIQTSRMDELHFGLTLSAARIS